MLASTLIAAPQLLYCSKSCLVETPTLFVFRGSAAGTTRNGTAYAWSNYTALGDTF